MSSALVVQHSTQPPHSTHREGPQTSTAIASTPLGSAAFFMYAELSAQGIYAKCGLPKQYTASTSLRTIPLQNKSFCSVMARTMLRNFVVQSIKGVKRINMNQAVFERVWAPVASNAVI
eukprot:524254-Pelagomonas_calceolata.AAC.6